MASIELWIQCRNAHGPPLGFWYRCLLHLMNRQPQESWKSLYFVIHLDRLFIWLCVWLLALPFFFLSLSSLFLLSFSFLSLSFSFSSSLQSLHLCIELPSFAFFLFFFFLSTLTQFSTPSTLPHLQKKKKKKKNINCVSVCVRRVGFFWSPDGRAKFRTVILRVMKKKVTWSLAGCKKSDRKHSVLLTSCTPSPSPHCN